MKAKFTVIIVCLFALAACGSGDSSDFADDVPTQVTPTVSRVAPAAGKVGDTITIFGFGFSDIPPNNIVIIGGANIAATAYNLVPSPTATEIESLTATVPTGAAVGVDSVYLLVNENTSNTDITFTVTP